MISLLFFCYYLLELSMLSALNCSLVQFLIWFQYFSSYEMDKNKAKDFKPFIQNLKSNMFVKG